MLTNIFNDFRLVQKILISQFIKKHNLPKYRIEQFNQHFYKDALESFGEFFSFSKEIREKLENEVEFMSLELDKEFVSKTSNTTKVLFKRKDGQRIETVLMGHKDGRNTVCVSCMVGCPVNCKFCATGKMGFGGNLSATEIVDQVMYFQRKLIKKDQKVTNIVFMGMGEPMLNLRAVEGAIDVLTAEDKLGMSQRRITISTSGYVRQLKQFVDNGFKGRVAISLHAPNQELRERLMPVAKQHSLDELLEVLDEHVQNTNKRVSYEYIMIKNVNDTPQHAMELVDMFKERLAHINLIPYNPIREETFERSPKGRIKDFCEILEKHRINHSVRFTMGDDVNAACGQLADRENKKAVERAARIKERKK